MKHKKFNQLQILLMHSSTVIFSFFRLELLLCGLMTPFLNEQLLIKNYLILLLDISIFLRHTPCPPCVFYEFSYRGWHPQTFPLQYFRDGEKMSKRKKNYPDPMEIINKHGSDALRWVTVLCTPPPWMIWFQQ